VETLGAMLDPSIDVFWTGEEVCSRAFSATNLDRIAERLRRKPILWDNYPVNDGKHMSRRLHVRAFTGRPSSIGDSIAAHAINPALQPVLTRIPALTLSESYRLGASYEYGRALAQAASDVLGADLAALLLEDIGAVQDVGLDQLGTDADRLRRRYSASDHPAAREIIAWLDGQYRFSADLVVPQ
jgi:hyaluronoglucosaminidase